MADAELTASLNLLNGISKQLNKCNIVSTSFSRHACRALLSRPSLGMTAGSPSAQQQQIADACGRIFEVAGKLVAKGSFSEQGLMIQILGACIQSCDSVSLLERAVGCGAQLTEAIRRSEAGVGAADATAATAPAGAAMLAQAACAAAAVLFGRLQSHIELPGVRRVAASIVPKLVPQLLSLLQTARQLPCSCQVAALQLLAALLRCVPSALRSTAPLAERALQQIVLAAAVSTGSSSGSAAPAAVQQQVLAQAAVCAALLPAVQGDAATWSETAHKLLSSSHDVLDYLLMGLEGRPTDPHYRSYLAPAAGDAHPSQQPAATIAANGWLPRLPWEQQQQQLQGAAVSTAASRRQTTPARMLLSMCISALHHLVQQPYAAPVPVPGYSLALLAARLLQFDAGAAVSAGAVAGSSTMYQEVLVLQPQLQQAGWQLLQVVADVAGQQLQLQGLLLRVVRQGLREVQLSGPAGLLSRPASVRCCIYATASQLLCTTGLAGARALAAEAMGCAVLELYASSSATTTATGGAVVGGSKGGQRPAKRAKTTGGASGNEFEHFDAAASAAAVAAGDDVSRLAVAGAADLAAQASALQLLRAMLEAGGQLLPADVRAHADAVAYHIAQTSAAAALRLQQQPAVSSIANGSNSCSSALGSLQVAAYQAMRASLLVPCGNQPPFLSQAVLLFRQGRSSSNPAVATVCQAAALQCESLLHPRATSMSGVRQYVGMDAVKPLTKPQMWAAVDAAVGQASAVGVIHDKAVCQSAENAGSQQQQAGPGQQNVHAAGADSSAAAASSRDCPATTDLVVVGYPVNLPNGQQQQQRHPPQSIPIGTSAAGVLQQGSDQGASAALAAHGSAAMDVNKQGKQQPQQHNQQKQTAAQDVEQQPHPICSVPVSTGVTNVFSPKGSASAAGDAVIAAPAAATAPPACSPLPSTAEMKARTAVFDEESSDSEGPLPDIDSGAGSSAEEEQEEE